MFAAQSGRPSRKGHRGRPGAAGGGAEIGRTRKEENSGATWPPSFWRIRLHHRPPAGRGQLEPHVRLKLKSAMRCERFPVTSATPVWAIMARTPSPRRLKPFARSTRFRRVPIMSAPCGAFPRVGLAEIVNRAVNDFTIRPRARGLGAGGGYGPRSPIRDLGLPRPRRGGKGNRSLNSDRLGPHARGG